MKRAPKIALISLASLVGLLVLLAVFAAAFNWNRAKPWIDAKVSAATGRSFAINGDLALSWRRPPHARGGWQGLLPWPHLSAHDVVFGNPPWATTGPDMARIRQVDFSINPFALLHRTISVQSLVLTDPHLVLEQGSGNRANWHFQKQQKSPSRWNLQIQDVGIEQGKVRYVDPKKKADFSTDIATFPDGSVKWKSSGRFNKDELSGHGTAGAILSLQQSGVHYPVKAELKVGKSTIRIDGTLTNPTHASALDVKLKVLGASMADLFPFSGVLLPETPKFSIEGRLSGNLKPGSIKLRYQDFKGKVGSSDLSGTLEYAQHEPRSSLHGEVVSQHLNLNDLQAVIGSGSAAAKRNASSVKQPPGKLLPVAPFKTDRWKTMDVDATFTGKEVVRSGSLPIDHMHVRIKMDDGVLSLAPLDFGVAGGRLRTELHINGRKDPARARMSISARGLRLSKMFPDVKQMHASVGQLHGDAKLAGSGNSIAALAGSADGDVHALITEGTVSRLILEEMGLNLGAAVAAKLFGDNQVTLNCMVADLGIQNGLMKTRTFVVDTTDALVDISGTVNLASEKMALGIHTKTKGTRLLSLRSPLHVAGTFKHPDLGVDKGQVALKAGAAIALGTVAAPVAALLALVQPSRGEKSPCAALEGKGD